jgi:hypothetical protein
MIQARISPLGDQDLWLFGLRLVFINLAPEQAGGMVAAVRAAVEQWQSARLRPVMVVVQPPPGPVCFIDCIGRSNVCDGDRSATAIQEYMLSLAMDLKDIGPDSFCLFLAHGQSHQLEFHGTPDPPPAPPPSSQSPPEEAT